MGEKKEGLQREWEEVRYLGQDEDMELKEKLEDMKLDIEDTEERVGRARCAKNTNILSQFQLIRGGLSAFGEKHDGIKRSLNGLAMLVTGQDQVSSYVFSSSSYSYSSS